MKEIILREKGTMHVERKKHSGKRCKPVVCVTNGMRFASATDAAEYAGVHLSSISLCCLGKVTNVKGNVYKYVKEETENCVDVLADTLQKQRQLLEKYAPLIAELEAKEEEEKLRKLDEERKQKAIEKAKAKYARAEEKFAKASEAKDKADARFDSALDDLYNAKQALDSLC